MNDWPREGMELSRSATSVRGTQSFVRIMQWTWFHPGVVGLEVLWRWIYGSFALTLLWQQGSRILASITGGTNDLSRLGLGKLTVTDPAASAARIAAVLDLVLPPALQVARWLVPLLLVTWVICAAVGRTLVLRRVDPTLHRSTLTLGLLQFLRVIALWTCLLLWGVILRFAGALAVTQPIARGEPPQLVEYFAIVIVGTLGFFTAWAIFSWALSLAPLLTMITGRTASQSLHDAFVRGPVRMKLVEINLVMGIVKIALIVLAMVFSACPLPFESVITPEFLFWWTAGVALLYLLASDFFHVARQVAYLELWRAYAEAT